MEITKQLAQEGLEMLKGTKAFVVAQAPDYMRQLILWNIADGLFGVIVGLALGLGGAWLLRKAYGEPGSREGWQIVETICGLVAVIGGGAFFLCGSGQVLKAWLAPKVFLLEYFAGILK